MAKLVNMKREGDEYEAMPSYSTEAYPYGLCLYLNEDQCEKLGISKALKPGTQVTISAKAVVTSATESLERDGDDKGNDVSLSIQITDLGVSANGVMRNAAAELYGNS